MQQSYGVDGEMPFTARRSDVLACSKNFMNCILALVLLLSTCPTVAQEQPTVKQCRADREAWGSLTGEDMDKLSFKEVDRRVNELSLCRFVDQPKLGDYVSFSAVLEREEKRRMFLFIDRHGYWQQFLQEDDHGER